jgi:hypothetical protein
MISLNLLSVYTVPPRGFELRLQPVGVGEQGGVISRKKKIMKMRVHKTSYWWLDALPGFGRTIINAPRY